MGVVALFVGGCAEVEPSGTNQGQNEDETTPDAGTDADADEETDTYDPCSECGPREVCNDDQECVDGCLSTSTQCGTTEFMDEQVECGGCQLGECQGGECPDVCEQYEVECGEVYFDGEAYECGECGNDQRCLENNVCTPDQDYIDVALGRSHSCAARSTGSVRCWGLNGDGQLGDGAQPENSSSPSVVPDLAGVRLISSLNHHTCVAARTEQEMYCWGANASGELGDGTVQSADTPAEVGDFAGSLIDAGGEHTCGVTDQERMSCWGLNDDGQLGGGHSGPTDADEKLEVLELINPEEPLKGVVDTAVGLTHTCALNRDNEVRCWGRNNYGQLGIGDNEDGPMLADETVSFDTVIIGIDAGFNHTCARNFEGTAYCWGHGQRGQLGQGSQSDETAPVAVDLEETVVDLATGRFHTCAATRAGEVYCWGANGDGQAGQPDGSDSIETPQPVEGLDDVHTVDAGGAHSCAVNFDGEVHCWGANEEGQLGDGTTTGRAQPGPVDE